MALKDEVRSEFVHVRVTPEMRSELDRLSKVTRISVSEAFRIFGEWWIAYWAALVENRPLDEALQEVMDREGLFVIQSKGTVARRETR